MKRTTVTHSVLIGLGFIFLLSLALELFWPGRLTRVELRFPLEIGKSLAWEARPVPMTWNKEKNAENVIKEALLGPMRPDCLRLFSRSAGLRNIYSKNQTLYVDLDLSTLRPDPEVRILPLAALSVLKKDILFNVPGYEKVEFAFQGRPLLDNFR
jgi:hypothetical protein